MQAAAAGREASGATHSLRSRGPAVIQPQPSLTLSSEGSRASEEAHLKPGWHTGLSAEFEFSEETYYMSVMEQQKRSDIIVTPHGAPWLSPAVIGFWGDCGMEMHSHGHSGFLPLGK